MEADSDSDRRIDKRDTTMDIDFDFLVKLFNDQDGLCAYSGLPFQFNNKENWRPSLERIDVYKGYVKTNVCLICIEFQSQDFSVVKKERPDDSTGWTKDKFKLFKDSVTKKYNF